MSPQQLTLTRNSYSLGYMAQLDKDAIMWTLKQMLLTSLARHLAEDAHLRVITERASHM